MVALLGDSVVACYLQRVQPSVASHLTTFVPVMPTDRKHTLSPLCPLRAHQKYLHILGVPQIFADSHCLEQVRIMSNDD